MNYDVKKWWIVCLVAIMVISPILLAGAAQADKLSDAISKAPQGKADGQIDPAAPKGYLGIPGGPDINLILAFCWAIWVGWIFSIFLWTFCPISDIAPSLNRLATSSEK